MFFFPIPNRFHLFVSYSARQPNQMIIFIIVVIGGVSAMEDYAAVASGGALVWATFWFAHWKYIRRCPMGGQMRNCARWPRLSKLQYQYHLFETERGPHIVEFRDIVLDMQGRHSKIRSGPALKLQTPPVIIIIIAVLWRRMLWYGICCACLLRNDCWWKNKAKNRETKIHRRRTGRKNSVY